MLSGRYFLLIILVITVFFTAACTPAQYAAWADRDAYWMLKRGQNSALGDAGDFNIIYDPVDGGHYLSRANSGQGDNAKPVLPLGRALQVAFRNSREFQTQKELLFSAALNVANLSREWESLLLSGAIDAMGNWTHSQKDGAPGGTDFTSRAMTAEGTPSLSRRLIGGGLLTLGATLDFAKDFLGFTNTQIGSLLEANFTQPLLRGAWRGLAYEDQYRLHRDFLFDVFEFARFRQTFAAEIVREYYNVLILRDRVENDRLNIQRLEETFAVTKLLVQGGQVSQIQQDQAEQQLLNARLGLEASQTAYLNALDRFKITLGLPVSTELELDYPGALEVLRRAGPGPLPFDEQTAVNTALLSRANLLSARAAVRDADKDVEIAADNFLPQLDVDLGVSVPGTEMTKPARLQTHRHTRWAMLTFNYQLDQTDNRDAYRNAIILLDRSKRTLAQTEDNARLDVRNSFRGLDRSRRSYLLQVQNLAIARRRTKLARLQQKEGQASTRDVLEAEDSLRNAMNGLTSSLVNYTTTRLEFLAGLGMIDVDIQGRITERKKPFGFQRLREQYPYLSIGAGISDDGEAQNMPVQDDEDE